MSTFKVEWEQELYRAEGPLEAAKNAMEDLKPGGALCFTVTNMKTGEKFSVDLNEDDETAVVPMPD